MLDTILSILYKLTYLILAKMVFEKWCYYPDSSEEKTEAWKG